MAFLGSIFKRKKSTSSPNTKGKSLSVELLKQLIPIRGLSEEKLKSFALEKKSEFFSRGEMLFKIDELADSTIYLIQGTVSLADNNGKSFEIEDSEAKAKFPLSSGLKHTTTAIAVTDINILRVSQKIMSISSENFQSSEIIIPEELSQSALLQSFIQHYNDEDLVIPILPHVVIQLQQAMREDIGIEEAVKIIQLDPVISAKIIEVANCPLYLSSSPVKSCFEAIKRIGLYPTRSLVISLGIKNIFRSDSRLIKKQMHNLWQNSIYLSSLCYVLAFVSNQKNPEEALLAGLICDIGAIPFLAFAADFPEKYCNEEEIVKILPLVKGIVGTSVLKSWGFDEEFVQVPLNSEDWFKYTDEYLSYSDIVVLSRLHSKIGKKEQSNLPMITSIPAASKLKNITLSPENSISILHEAKDKINEALKAFSV